MLCKMYYIVELVNKRFHEVLLTLESVNGLSGLSPKSSVVLSTTRLRQVYPPSPDRRLKKMSRECANIYNLLNKPLP